MDHFTYQHDELYAEQVSVKSIVERWGTPCYIYSRATLERHWHVFDAALGKHQHMICYAVKANSNLAILNILAKLGSGFDVVSGGELIRALKAGADPQKIIFSGVGKTHAEIRQALMAGIYCLNAESTSELDRINQVATELNVQAPIGIRVNPNIDAKTHPYIATGLKENKFGIDIEIAAAVYQHASRLPHLNIKGIAFHIGSQLLELDPFLEAIDRILQLIQTLKQLGIKIQHLDLGGGLGVRYQEEIPPSPAHYAEALGERIKDPAITVIIEPGRVITANAGILVTQVEYLKMTAHKNFAIVDAGMNDLIRPALYDAWHDIIAVTPKNNIPTHTYDVVGPVCETGDFLGKDRKLAVSEGDLLAIRSAGAYGFIMSSNYNSRPRAAEIMVDGDQAYLIRRRETMDDLWAGEQLLP